MRQQTPRDFKKLKETPRDSKRLQKTPKDYKKHFFAGKYLGTLYIGLKQLIFLRRYSFSTNPFNKVGNTK